MNIAGVNISGIIVAIEILIKIFFYYSLVGGNLIISLSFFYEDSIFIYFLECLRDCCFILGEIYTILLYLSGFLNNRDNISDLLLL